MPRNIPYLGGELGEKYGGLLGYEFPDELVQICRRKLGVDLAEVNERLEQLLLFLAVALFMHERGEDVSFELPRPLRQVFDEFFLAFSAHKGPPSTVDPAAEASGYPYDRFCHQFLGPRDPEHGIRANFAYGDNRCLTPLRLMRMVERARFLGAHVVVQCWTMLAREWLCSYYWRSAHHRLNDESTEYDDQLVTADGLAAIEEGLVRECGFSLAGRRPETIGALIGEIEWGILELERRYGIK